MPNLPGWDTPISEEDPINFGLTAENQWDPKWKDWKPPKRATDEATARINRGENYFAPGTYASAKQKKGKYFVRYSQLLTGTPEWDQSMKDLLEWYDKQIAEAKEAEKRNKELEANMSEEDRNFARYGTIRGANYAAPEWDGPSPFPMTTRPTGGAPQGRETAYERYLKASPYTPQLIDPGYRYVNPYGMSIPLETGDYPWDNF